VLNSVPRHEGVLGEWRYNSTQSWTRHQIEVSDQVHAPDVLPPGKETLVPNGHEAGLASQTVMKRNPIAWRDSNPRSWNRHDT
jgi:hypothetical protein